MFDPTPMVPAVLAWLVETTLVASALALAAHLGGRIRSGGGPRWLSPAARHALWLVVLLKLVTPPLVHWPWSRPWHSMPEVAAVAVASPRPGHVPSITQNGTRAEPAQFIEAVSIPAGDSVAVADDDAPADATGPEPPTRSITRGVPAGQPAVILASPIVPRLGLCVAAVWLVATLAVGVGQARRILRFRRLLRGATPPPAWLVAEASRVGRRMAVRVPEIRVIDRLGTPLLWCLGRPVLLIPSALLRSLEAKRWRGILAHELAHLRRGDPWVRRLGLVAGLLWWWNPLYRLVLRRLDFEAELACDAIVLWALPDDRYEYAESLVQICTSLSKVRPLAPALGVAGSGQSFERRLMMILRDRVSHRVSLPGVLAAALLALLALPSWTLAGPASGAASGEAAASAAFEGGNGLELALALVDDDDDDAKPAKKKLKAAKPAKPAKSSKSKKEKTQGQSQGESHDAFQEKMEQLGERIGKEIEAKFGPEFEKKMEAIGKEIEAKFGPEFEKKMEAIGKEIEAKFGENSEFGQEMKELGESMAKQYGPGSEFAEQMAKKAVGDKAQPAPKAKKAPRQGQGDKAPRVARKKEGEAKIKALESQINQMMKELERLKQQTDQDDDDDDSDDDMDEQEDNS